MTPASRVLSRDQSSLARDYYAYAMTLAVRRAARYGPRGRVRLEQYRDVATDELLRTVVTHDRRGIATYKTYLTRTVLLSLRNADRRRFHRESPGLPAGLPANLVDRTGPLRSHPVDETDAFQSMLAQLPARQRAILSLLFRDGLTIREAARSLGRSKSRVGADLTRALDTLRRAVG